MSSPGSMKTKIKIVHGVISLNDLKSAAMINDEHAIEERKDEEDDSCSVDNILSFLKKEIRLKKVCELWLECPPIIKDQIEEILVDYLVQNCISLDSISNILSNVLCEVLRGRMKHSVKALVAKEDIQNEMEKKCILRIDYLKI